MDERWRTKELSRKEVIEKYPQVPPITVLKTDVSRRGILYTDKAFDKVDINRHHIEPEEFMGTGRDLGKRVSPIGITLRDGSLICRGHWADKTITREPYYIDVVDDKLVLVDEDEVLEEVEFWEKPNFYDKYTSNGTPMWKIASGRPQRISIVPYPKCDFWGTEVGGCKYCSLFATTRTVKEILRDDKYFQDVTETVEEALKQKGRYSVFHMTSGSAFSGKEPFDDEVELYIKTLQAAGKAFHGKSGGPRRAGFAASGAGHRRLPRSDPREQLRRQRPLSRRSPRQTRRLVPRALRKPQNARHREHLRLQRPFRGSYRAQLGRGRGGQPRRPQTQCAHRSAHQPRSRIAQGSAPPEAPQRPPLAEHPYRLQPEHMVRHPQSRGPHRRPVGSRGKRRRERLLPPGHDPCVGVGDVRALR